MCSDKYISYARYDGNSFNQPSSWGRAEIHHLDVALPTPPQEGKNMAKYKGTIITKSFHIISKLPDRFYIYEFRRKYLDVTYPFLSKLLKILEQKGLLVSEKTKRSKYYNITEKGREARELARKFVDLIS